MSQTTTSIVCSAQCAALLGHTMPDYPTCSSCRFSSVDKLKNVLVVFVLLIVYVRADCDGKASDL